MGTPLAQEPAATNRLPPSLIWPPPCETTKPDRYSLPGPALKPRRLFCANRCISPTRSSLVARRSEPSVAFVHPPWLAVRRGRAAAPASGQACHPLSRRVGSCVPGLDWTPPPCNFPHPHGHTTHAASHPLVNPSALADPPIVPSTVQH